MSAGQPYVILDNDDDDDDRNEYILGASIPIDLTESDDEESDSESEPEVVAESPPTSDFPSRGDPQDTASITLPEISIESYRLRTDEVVRPGDTVELKDSMRCQSMQSGDFLRVKYIIKNLETDEIRLRGYRMRRMKYFGPLFDWALNELAMVFNIDERDTRSLLIAGLEVIDIDEVFRTRECVITDKPRPPPGCGNPLVIRVPRSMSLREIKEHVFNNGVLACRSLYVQHTDVRKGKSYSGIVRHFHAREVEEFRSSDNNAPTHLPQSSITDRVDYDDDCVVVDKQSTQRRRRESSASSGVEILDEPPRRIKTGRLTFGDCFCGAGGASQGALQAGYSVRWGLDKDEQAVETYSLNHPNAFVFNMDAHDFPPRDISQSSLNVDVLHLSPPCCYFSPAHTTDGPNDQANYDAIFTIEETLRRVKPRVATLEQTFGLMTHEQHRKNFFKLLNDIGRAGYNLRYKMQDLSELGLAQKRKRLLIIAARRGTPLPPFPKMTHGPPGTNLKPFTTIADALSPMTRLGFRAFCDVYHQPRLFGSPRSSYSPHTRLKGCITTGGTTSHHPSGERHFTVRELSLLQGFPRKYHFTGTKTDASKQVGNAFPPVAAEHIYRTIAKTLSAFDKDLIGVEDDLDNMDELINEHDEVIELSDDDEIIELSDDE